MSAQRRMHLGAFLPAPGHHVAAWRHANTPADGCLDLDFYTGLARTAERGLFDLLFLSDGQGVRTHYADEEELSRWGRVVHFEPVTLLSALAATTTSIGLTATASTTYSEPFALARQFASLDWLSAGRAGWNIVTSVTDAEAQNFNLSHQPEHELRYRRADEFLQVTTGLWDSWDDGAFVFDKAAGRSFDPSTLHILRHRGEFFSVRGPLNVARCPQGRPVLIQAGSSETGRDFAARWAEVIFTAQDNLVDAQRFYSDLRRRLAAAGRDPDHARVLPGAFVVVGRTLGEAEDKYESLQRLVDPTVGLGLLTGLLGDVDLSGLNLDEPLPPLPETEGSRSRQELVYLRALREGLTVRQLYLTVTGARGHLMVLGTPTVIADVFEEWFTERACDGFNVMPPQLPDALENFVDLVVPELQRRGLFRNAYQGSMLRDHLGLPRPANRFTRSLEQQRKDAGT